MTFAKSNASPIFPFHNNQDSKYTLLNLQFPLQVERLHIGLKLYIQDLNHRKIPQQAHEITLNYSRTNYFQAGHLYLIFFWRCTHFTQILQ